MEPTPAQTEATRDIAVTRVFQRNYVSQMPIVLNEGGARSSKSHSIGQLLVMRFWNERNRKILVSRKYSPSLNLTAYKLIIDLLADYGHYDHVQHSKVERVIQNPRNGSLFAFFSIDNPTKVRSMEWTDAWLEEATEFTWDDFLAIKIRMSGPRHGVERPNQIFASYNPDDEQSWLLKRIRNAPAFSGQFDYIHSTYKDNPFLDKAYIKDLESLKDQDPDAWKIYGLGEVATLKHVIYEPFLLVQEFPEEIDERIYGLDFGFNNPSALVEIGIKDKRDHYVREIIYQSGLNNGQLIERMGEVIPPDQRGCPIYADSAEPARIDEIHRAGFNIHPADKSVLDGIDYCKRQRILTLAENVNMNKERSSYKWRQDKNGNVIDKEPVAFNNHCFVSGTMVETESGPRPIEAIECGEKVLTRGGLRPVIASWKTRECTDVADYDVDGTVVTATPSHRVYANGAFKPISQLAEGDEICKLIRSCSVGQNSPDTRTRKEGAIASISRDTSMAMPCRNIFTAKYGSRILGAFRQVIMSITRMVTPWTTGPKISNASPAVSICPNTGKQGDRFDRDDTLHTSKAFEQKRRNGIEAMLAESGTANTPSDPRGTRNHLRGFAGIASLRISRTGPGFVQTRASLGTEGRSGPTMKSGYAECARQRSSQTDIPGRRFALSRVREVRTGQKRKAAVYNITVAGKPEYFANGILVHNCMDAMRYGAYTHHKARLSSAGVWFID